MSDTHLLPPDFSASPVIARVRRSALVLAAMAAVIALFTLLLGWIAGVQALVRLDPDFPAMVPETALCIMLGGLGVIWTIWRPRQLVVPQVCGGLILVLVAMALTQPIRTIAFRPLDSMSVATALASVLVATCLMLPREGDPSLARLHTTLQSLGLSVVMVPVLGYIFDAEALFANAVYTSMALHTALGFLALFLALLCERPAQGWVGVLLSPERGSEMVRRILPVIIFGPIIMCSLTLYATYHEFMTPNFRLAVLTFMMICATGVAALLFAHQTNLSERRAAAVEASLRRSELARAQTELAMSRSQKVEALGKLVGGVAHDFNNSLAVILGNLELLEEDDSAAARQRYISEAIAASNSAAHLTRQLLAYGRRSRLESLPNVLDDLITPTLEMFRRVNPANIEIVTDLDTDHAIVMLDSANFQQALLNLLINARDAMPAGGRITLSTRVETLAQESVAGFDQSEDLPPGTYVTVSVRDNGTGMDAATLNRADEPFFTTKGIHEGTGLGLSVVSGFCRQSEGGLRLRSAPGAGTTVSMAFPLAQYADPLPAVPRPRPSVTPGAGADILIVDDEIRVSRVMARQLQLDGHRVRIALNAEQALNVLSTEDAPDLVLSDLVMPGDMQGHALAETIRERWPQTRIVLMSGYESARRRREIFGLRDLVFLQKPVDRATLRATVLQALNGDEAG
ncbi:response regulator [Paroceanicella profunda]|uniref:histidine kinase n=1 Tax=Paroceanicella profunda TaxID=2579971 RepID=A0A5B8G275_9RHOB|nr:response regulator [Paroceanicella profunda]QDL93399.1 response regulator [Paroceanicella profunda]